MLCFCGSNILAIMLVCSWRLRAYARRIQKIVEDETVAFYCTRKYPPDIQEPIPGFFERPLRRLSEWVFQERSEPVGDSGEILMLPEPSQSLLTENTETQQARRRVWRLPPVRQSSTEEDEPLFEHDTESTRFNEALERFNQRFEHELDQDQPDQET